MERRFGARELPETSQARFQQAKQKTDECLEDWADRALTLATRAFKALPYAYMYQQAVTRVCQGLLDKEAGVYAANSRPTTIDAAIDRIRWFQHTNQAVYGRSTRRDVRCISSESNSDVSPVSVRTTTVQKETNPVVTRLIQKQQIDRYKVFLRQIPKKNLSLFIHG